MELLNLLEKWISDLRLAALTNRFGILGKIAKFAKFSAFPFLTLQLTSDLRTQILSKNFWDDTEQDIITVPNVMYSDYC